MALEKEFPNLTRIFGHYQENQATLIQITQLYLSSLGLQLEGGKTLQYIERLLANRPPRMYSFLRRYSSYRAGVLALLSDGPPWLTDLKMPDEKGETSASSAIFLTIKRASQEGGEGAEAFGYRLQNVASVKSRGYNLNYCVNILRNAIGVPRQYWEQLQHFYYMYALQLNKVGMMSFPGEIGPLASPYWASQMKDKLSKYGKQCLQANPYRTSGEPYYSARCFLEGVMLPGSSKQHKSWYVATKGGQWQKLAMQSTAEHIDDSVHTNAFKAEDAFNEKIFGDMKAPYDSRDATGWQHTLARVGQGASEY